MKFLLKIIHPVIKFYWFVFRPKTYGVKCIIENDGKFLMIRNTYGDHPWTFSGGGIKKNESAESAAKREVKEEVGIDIKNLEKIGECISTAEYKMDTISIFLARVENNSFIIDNKEISEAQWFPKENFPQISEISKKAISIWKNR